MLYERKQLPELVYLKHLHDDDDKNYIDYENMVLDKTLSPYMFNNDVVSALQRTCFKHNLHTKVYI